MTIRCVLWLCLCCWVVSPLQAQQQLVFSGIQGSMNSEISKRVLIEAYQPLGIQIKVEALPGERALQTSNSGAVDGELFRIANVQKRYNNLVAVPTPINRLQGIVFTKRKRFVVKGWDSLKPYELGIQLGIKFAERGTQGMNRVLVETNEQLFKMLHNERVEVVVVSFVNGLQTLQKLKLPDIRPLEPAIQEFPLFHYLHKKNEALVPKLNAVLLEMQKRQRIQAIRNHVVDELRQGIRE